MADAPTIEIAGRAVGGRHPCCVIAEVGINHGGDEARCAAMIDAAATAGADAVKLQTVTPDESYHPDTESYRLFRDSMLTEAALERLMRHARRAGVILFSTPGDFTALALIDRLGMPAIKISSGLLTNLPLIGAAAATGRPLILSTGMASLDEVEEAVAAARANGCAALAVLQCTSLYPAPATSLNLRAMATLAASVDAPVGYSDHHTGALAAVAAVAAGARLIEKHFTLDASTPGADHAISLEPDAFVAMVRDIRDVEAMLGSAEKAPLAAEAALRDGRHRRLVAARDLGAGAVLAAGDLYLMRLPADRAALPARQLPDVLGRRLARAVSRLSGITADMVEGLA
ncbi:MAG: N-acetylneuraminate synthase family protein [Candidatus Eiseniibacteriota bacterium]